MSVYKAILMLFSPYSPSVLAAFLLPSWKPLPITLFRVLECSQLSPQDPEANKSPSTIHQKPLFEWLVRVTQVTPKMIQIIHVALGYP